MSVTRGELEARLPDRVGEIEASDAVAVVFGDQALKSPSGCARCLGSGDVVGHALQPQDALAR